MRKVFDIGHTDLRIFLGKPAAWIWLFLAPLVFVYFMGLAIHGNNDPVNWRPPLLVENHDTNFLGRVFLKELDTQGLRLVDPTNSDEVTRGVRIPSDFTSALLHGERSKIHLFERQGSGEASDALVELGLVRALIAVNCHIIETTGFVPSNNLPQAGDLSTLSEVKLRQVMARPDPVRLDAHFAGRKPIPSGFNFSLPGNLVMYLMLNLLVFGGVSISASRNNGVMRRFLTNPVTRNQIVLGKIYGLMLVGSVQIVYLLLVGKFLLGVNLGANLPAVMLTLLILAWVGGSFGVLIGSLVSSEDRVVGICILISVMLAALGGCWWPLEIAPQSLKTISLCTPSGWALQALHMLISFGSGLGAVIVPLAVLSGFGCAAHLLAVRFFRTD